MAGDCPKVGKIFEVSQGGEDFGGGRFGGDIRGICSSPDVTSVPLQF